MEHAAQTSTAPSVGHSDGGWRALLPTTPAAIALFAAWLVILALGLWGLYDRLATGHEQAGYGSYVPWGLWVAIYFHLVGMAGGAFVVGGLGYLLHWRGFRRPATLRTVSILSIALILPAFLGVWLDLGHMERAQEVFFSPTFTSMMAFNAWMYAAFVVVAALVWALSYRSQTIWLRPLIALGLLLSVAFPSQSGAFFGVVDARPYWASALLPLLFLASAIIAGSAVLLLMAGVSRAGLLPAGREDGSRDLMDGAPRLRTIVLVGIIVYFFFEFAEFSIALWSPTADAPALELVLWGPYWWVFWIVHLGLGGIVPIALLATRSRGAWVAAAGLVVLAFISARLNILIPGQAIGEIEGLQDAFTGPRLTYTYNATLSEYLIALLLIALAVAVYYVGLLVSAAVSRRASSGAREEA